jgi:hypothetical protein
MQMRYLVQIAQSSSGEWICSCPTLSFEVSGDTEETTLQEIELLLESHADFEGRRHIEGHSKNAEGVNCPEGYVRLPGDIWHCKLDDQLCKLQAWISLDAKDKFMARCRASDKRKEDIYRIVTEGVYSGFHHLPGRYLCPICKGKVNTRYFYPWELTPLSHFLDINDQSFRIALIEKNISMSVIAQALCPDCLIQVVSEISPGLSKDLRIIEVDFDRSPPRKQQGETFLYVEIGEEKFRVSSREGEIHSYFYLIHQIRTGGEWFPVYDAFLECECDLDTQEEKEEFIQQAQAATCLRELPLMNEYTLASVEMLNNEPKDAC